MESLSKSGLCRWFKKKPVSDYNLHAFLHKKLPIFWVMGPPGCGKSTLAEMLAQSSRYHLLRISDLLREDISKGKTRGKIIYECLNKGRDVPNSIIVNLIKEAFLHSPEHCIGYIIDGFPLDLCQAKLFEKQICKVTLIIYVTLVLDALLARKITQIGAFDPNDERLKYVHHTKRLKAVARKYEHQTIKLHANYPPEDTCTRLVENLEDFWGYKFLRLYNKNQ